MSEIPIVLRGAAEVFARRDEQDISVAQFCADIEAVAAALPQARHIINLCQDRYRFTVTFFAALVRRQTNLLPAKRDIAAARNLAGQYEACSIVTDEDTPGVDHRVDFVPGTHGQATSPACLADQVAGIAFTSGSTGAPVPHPKTWQMLCDWRAVHQRYLPGPPTATRAVISTVPSWHMYGLEWAMLLPTVAPLTLYCGPDFFPRDVVAALSGFNSATVLVSTPVHLRALSRVPAPTRPVETVISATAPLDTILTRHIETHLTSRVFEIYGCSEAGSLAWRSTGTNKHWQFFDCFDVRLTDGEISVGHPLLRDKVKLADRFTEISPGAYVLEGRSSDIIKVAGKRESLTNLNAILTNIVGVEDGVIFLPEAPGPLRTTRLAAFAVAPELSTHDIKAALAEHIDPVFLPRPIRLLSALPRDKTSKIRQDTLTQLMREFDG